MIVRYLKIFKHVEIIGVGSGSGIIEVGSGSGIIGVGSGSGIVVAGLNQSGFTTVASIDTFLFLYTFIKVYILF